MTFYFAYGSNLHHLQMKRRCPNCRFIKKIILHNYSLTFRSKYGAADIEKKRKSRESIENTKLQIDFGSQIRNYILHPYKLVKDIRTNIERSDVSNVLDGDIDDFIKAYLLQKEN